MGQSQSTAEENDDTPHDATPKKDYYELLGVERTATDDEIKKAYRRKALELHPDRNYGNVEDATKLFAEIQSAHEVLSDPQERAWYDSHRDVLLRGDTVGGEGGGEFSYNVKMTTADEVLKLMMKFNGRLDFSDAPSGFYGGLDEFFKGLAKEEDIACQWEDQEPLDYPDFGSMDDDYEDVVRPFYAAWAGFVTKKSYAWKDQYRLSDAPDRRIRRLMEKENRKLRDDAIQEYNEAVRVLVAFIRKRDPRVRNNQKSEAERQQALKEAAAAQAARSRAARQAKIEELEQYEVPAWAQSRTQDEHEGGFSSESEVEEHEYDCVVCEKTFKSEAQYNAHEKSKKHIKLLKQLKREMKAEGKDLDLEGKPTNEVELIDDGLDEYDDDSRIEEGITNTSENLNVHEHMSDSQSEQGNSNSEDLLQTDAQSPNEATEDSFHSDSDSDYAPRSKVKEHIDDTDTISTLSSTLASTILTDRPASTSPSDPDLDRDSSQPKLGKAKQKRAKKAAAATVGPSTTTATGEFNCAVCAANFDSKTKLFKHIKDKGHAAPLTQIRAAGGKGKGKKR